MSGGRPPKLTYPALRRIDEWMADRKISVRVMCRILKVSPDTIYDAYNRMGAYRGCAKSANGAFAPPELIDLVKGTEKFRDQCEREVQTESCRETRADMTASTPYHHGRAPS